MFMPSISGPSITSSGRDDCWRASSVSSIDERIDARDQRMRQALAATGSSRQARSSRPLLAARRRCTFGDLQQPLGGVVAAIEHDVFDAFAQFGGQDRRTSAVRRR